MKSFIVLTIALLICAGSYAQFVGDGASTPAAVNATPKQKPTFTIKYGLALPSGNFGTVPIRNAAPQYAKGYMGASSGFFAEAGFGMSLSKSERKVGFYYFPLLFAYWKTSLDWSSLGAPFNDDKIYAKPMRAMDIGQRYGVFFKPMDKMSVALYYRPGLILPLDFDITSPQFQFSGKMSVSEKAPVLTLSSSPGIMWRYSFISVSLEGYFVKPTYDVIYKDLTKMVDKQEMSKIPVKMFLLSLSLNL